MTMPSIQFTGTAVWAYPLYVVLGLVGWLASVVLYRLYFHPIAKVPGPRLAAVTNLYRTYFNANGAKFYEEVARLHEQYGPVIRIGPNEVHLSDPENYDKIYYVGTKYSKSPEFYLPFGYGTSAFSTPSNELHRVRRGALNPLFSRKRVLELEDVVQSKAEKLDKRLAKATITKEPVDLHHGLRAISVDTITDYGFGDCYNLLDQEDLGRQFLATMRDLGPAVWFFQQWPFLKPLAESMPYWLAKILNQNLASFMQLQNECREKIVVIKEARDAGEKMPERITMFHQLLDPNATEGHVVPSVDAMRDESFVILSAAADTTGNAMTIALYETLRDDNIHQRVLAELTKAFPDASKRLDFQTLEKLPYLTAIIKEGLRLSYGVIGRLPRVTPEPGAEFNGFFLPTGTIVGMSSYMMHRNPKAFPNPEKFDPERWMDPAAAKKLEKYLVPFSKGSRQCIGMPLAYAELYVTLGTLLRRYPYMQTEELTGRSLEYEDYFAPYRPIDAKRFTVTSYEP